MEIIEKHILSSDNDHVLAGKVYIPDSKPRGLLHIVHGMQEHIGRYDRFMREMAGDGYIVFGFDLLGHGSTARDMGEMGFFAHKDGWKRLVDDVSVFGDAVRNEYGRDLEYNILGHSMGSFIVRLAALNNDYDRMILTGTGGPLPGGSAGIAFLSVVKAFKYERYYSPMAEKIAFGKYNERFGNDDPVNWLSKVDEVREADRADPLCACGFTVSAYIDLLKLLRGCNSRKWAGSLNKSMPVLMVSGSDDPVGNYGKGVMKVRDMLAHAGVPVTVKLYENCRHEVLNETCREDALNEIRNFLKE